MEKEDVEVPDRTHDQPAEGGRDQADRALENDEQSTVSPADQPGRDE